jgi:hypothetical protein
VRGNYASSRMRNAYPAYTSGGPASSGLPMELPLLSSATYELILVSDMGVTATGSSVDSWTDQSSNAYSAVGVGGARPTINGTDGSKQTIRWANTSHLSVANFALSTSFTMFVRSDIDQAAGAAIFFEQGAAVDSNIGFLFNPNPVGGDPNFGGINRIATGACLRTVVDVATNISTARSLLVLGYNAGTQLWTMRQNGVDLAQDATNGTPPSGEVVVTDTLYLGRRGGNSNPSSTVWISTIVICEGVLTAGEITSAESAIGTYFA